MHEINVTNVRCFHKRCNAPITPITLLVGENSTGKTTFLASTRIAKALCTGRLDPDFNQDPFMLGAYDQIANYRGGRGGRAKHFQIGCKIDGLAEDTGNLVAQAFVSGRFVNRRGQPFLSQWSLRSEHYSLTIHVAKETSETKVVAKTPSGTLTILRPPFMGDDHSLAHTLSALWYVTATSAEPIDGTKIEGDASREDVRALADIVTRVVAASRPMPYAFSPIRTKPQRTYDPMKEIPSPEGAHVPMILANTWSADDRLRNNINAFGEASGLYKELRVRRIGNNDSDPFQIQIKVAGPSFNLVDVGYGVSQALPLVVDTLREEPGTMFLLQQPEVHLHPRAQAAFGSFLATLASLQHKTFVIETHSDYLIDRIRMEARDGDLLKPSDVTVLYFERSNNAVKVRRVQLDSEGNYIRVPDTFRAFFLDEERKLLGI